MAGAVRAATPTAGARRLSAPAAAALAAAAALVIALTLGVVGVAATVGGSVSPSAQTLAGETGVPGGYGVSARARAEIPPAYRRLYLQAAARYRVDWAILAGIGRVECNHGRDPDPSCTKEGAVNSAGAGGPAQFLASTWRVYGVSAYGGGAPDRWNPADAIFGMANYLRASGAPADYRDAIYAYNHAWWYVAEVERWAAVYRGPPISGGSRSSLEQNGWGGRAPIAVTYVQINGTSATSVEPISGERAVLSPRDGHVALIPAGAPARVQAMVIAGNELQDLPYGPAGHPDPLGAPSEDCSSTVNYVLYRAGVRPLAELVRENPLAQSYVDWGLPGPGRWVTIYATDRPTAHAFVVIAGLRLDTSHDGIDVGPNRGEDGPRWRVLDRIPDWAHWSVRHPPGL
ncbi:MAG: lytic transglycosylase domain-containing protein [Solirubrobacterales bacterium]